MSYNFEINEKIFLFVLNFETIWKLKKIKAFEAFQLNIFEKHENEN